MTDTSYYANAAKELLSRRVSGTKASALPESIRPKSIEDALCIHQEMIKQRPDSVAGWKCLLPFDDKMIIAPIFADTVQTGDVCHLMPEEGKVAIEPEIVFTLAQDLPARETDYSNEEIDAAIGDCHMALELMQKRFAKDSNATFPEALADCLVNQGLYLGPKIDKALAYEASNIKLLLTQNDSVQEFDGVHPNPLPQLPIYWLINFMSKRGTNFKAGEAITTGSYAGIVEVDFDKETHIVYQGIGEYKVTFKAL